MSLLESKNGGPSIGNYKGVMLCNRPFGGVSGALKSNEVGVKAFGCGVVPAEIGAHVSLASKERHKIKRPKKESALTKHRKWLAELQNTKDRLEYEYAMEMQAKQDQKDKFKKQEKSLRQTSRAILHAEDGSELPQSDEKEPENNSPTVQQEAKDAKDTEVKKMKKVNKPAWAMASTAGNSAEDDELADLIGDKDEMEDLLGFAKTLDYDRYMNDMEVKLMMEQVRKRILDLERQVTQEEKRENDKEVEAARRELLALRELERGPQYDADEYDEVDEDEVAREAARDVLKRDDDIKNVHSTKSAAALIKTAKDKKAGVNPDSGPAMAAPKIVVHDPNEGTRLDGEAKNAVSNLPYMHRNPAI